MTGHDLLSRNLCASLVLTFLMAVIAVPNMAWAQILTLGTINDRPVKEAQDYQPLADYLKAELHGSDVTDVKVHIPTSIDNAIAAVNAGMLDLFIDSSLTAEIVRKNTGSRFLVRRWKKGQEKYRSVVFVRDDSPAQTLHDIKGKMLAFKSRYSTSGFFLPKVAIQQQGLVLKPYAKRQDKVDANVIGYLQARDNEAQVVWVERKMVAAAAMSESDYTSFADTALSPLRILHATQYVPYHVVVARPGLSPELLERIKSALLAADQSASGQKMLKVFERTAKFDEIPANLLQNLMKISPYLNHSN